MYSDVIDNQKTEEELSIIKKITKEDIQNCLKKEKFTSKDLNILISDEAENYLEIMAQKSKKITEQRFGKTMQLFIPMYLSNECFNSCKYCGFSIENKYPRTTLTKKEILEEGRILKNKGFKHLLLLTGEAPGKVGTKYICEAINILSPLFPSIGIEVQPLTEKDYRKTIESGADTLTLYQETYHPETYDKVHTRGKKKNFKYRLNTTDAAGLAGFYKINIGTLLGLYNWKYEALSLRDHLDYLTKKYWKTKFGISFPRIKDMIGEFTIENPVNDKKYVQIILAFRLCYPDINITLSTRENKELRDNLIHLGITNMSAESHTNPGGYSGKDAEKQFEISDTRSIEEIKDMLNRNGFEPVTKDWDRI